MTQHEGSTESSPESFDPTREVRITFDGVMPLEDYVTLRALMITNIYGGEFIDAILKPVEDLGKNPIADRAVFAAHVTAEAPDKRDSILEWINTLSRTDPEYTVMLWNRLMCDEDPTVRENAYDAFCYELELDRKTPEPRPGGPFYDFGLSHDDLAEILRQRDEALRTGQFVRPSDPLPEIPLPEPPQTGTSQG